jgi:hypothetical protein
MLREKLKEAGAGVQHILTQILPIPEASKDVSLLLAAKHYPASADLTKVLEAFQQYPEALAAMIKEFELLSADLVRP